MEAIRDSDAKVYEKNALFFGDNLTILRADVRGNSVDLIYLDPPFNSDRDYNLIYREQSGDRAASQVQAFRDTWTWDIAAQTSFEHVVKAGGPVAQAMRAFHELLSTSPVMAYLAMMAPRLTELERVLKVGGSIYLHCDPSASHYLKLLMDAVFGPRGFQNEIIWSYRRWPSPSNHYQRMHDVILFYAKGTHGPKTFHVQYEPNSPSYIKRFGGKTQMLDPETKTRKLTLEQESKGLPRRDVWEISIIAGSSKERLGYPTQKPVALLERIVETSSNPGDIILDPFCGCGTTIDAAQHLGRRWIGIDITYLAINAIQARLRDRYGKAIDDTYVVRGAPTALPEAEALAARDKYQFQWWAASLAGAKITPNDHKKGPDGGIDGRINFFDEATGKPQQMILSIKGGALKADDVRALRHVVEREGAELGALISLRTPTAGMRTDAATAGFYDAADGKQYPRVQLVTIKDLLEGKGLAMPRAVGRTHLLKQAAKAERSDVAQLALVAEEPDDYATS